MGGALPRWPQKEEECGKASGQFCVQPGHGNSSCPRTPRSPGEDAADWGPPSSSSHTTGSHSPLPWGAHTLRVLPGTSLRPHPPRRPWMADDLRNPRALSSPRAPARSAPVMLADTVKLSHPRLVDLHDYIPACNADQQLGSWSILNRRGFAQAFRPRLFCWGPTPHSARPSWTAASPQPLPAPGTTLQAVSLLWVSLTLSSPTWGSWGPPAKRTALVSSTPAYGAPALPSDCVTTALAQPPTRQQFWVTGSAQAQQTQQYVGPCLRGAVRLWGRQINEEMGPVSAVTSHMRDNKAEPMRQ